MLGAGCILGRANSARQATSDASTVLQNRDARYADESWEQLRVGDAAHPAAARRIGHDNYRRNRMNLGFWELTLLVLIPATAYASWIDYAERRVPNWLNAALAAAGIAAHAAFHGWSGVGTSLLGLLVGFGLLILPWMMHGMGAGDVKLMAAIGAWIGPWLTLWSFGVGAIIGGFAAVVMILSTGRAVHALTNMQTIMTKMKRLDTAFGEFGGAKTFGATSQLLPYGVPLTAGTWVVLLASYFGGWFA